MNGHPDENATPPTRHLEVLPFVLDRADHLLGRSSVESLRSGGIGIILRSTGKTNRTLSQFPELKPKTLS